MEPDATTDQNIEYEVGAMIVSGSQPGEVGVFPGSPADLAGLKEEDVIIAVSGMYLSQEEALSELISNYHPGDQVVVSVLRDGVRIEIALTLAEYGEE
jgi:S1-C subfamily serine protease